MEPELYSAFGLDAHCPALPFGPGLINTTWKIDCGERSYILQRINDKVFPHPAQIVENMCALGSYLEKTAPAYPFIKPLPAKDGSRLVHLEGSGYFRLTSFVDGSHTLRVAEDPDMAYEASRQFGHFMRLLSGFPAGRLHATLPGFHDLGLRQAQFESALVRGDALRIAEAGELIHAIRRFACIPERFERIRTDRQFILRVTHHDSKISNVLFDGQGKGICVIDLDTVMPGRFISDLGDLLRTCLSPVSEEERDYGLVAVRPAYFEAIVRGWLDEMGDELSRDELDHLVYAGKFMCYMQAIRFLTDYLLHDPYYGSDYPGHNLVRAGNQIVLLERLAEKEAMLNDLIKRY
ncbi:MAG: aminoglycoside phosphotransferase family protein [Bacteroidota bacterium]|nr:aminoglycoside phosphotransferase family protein [Bacteroidota bacterium]